MIARHRRTLLAAAIAVSLASGVLHAQVATPAPTPRNQNNNNNNNNNNSGIIEDNGSGFDSGSSFGSGGTRSGSGTSTSNTRRQSGKTVGKNAGETTTTAGGAAGKSGGKTTTKKKSGSGGGYTGAKATGQALTTMPLSIDRNARVMRLVPPHKGEGGFGFATRKGSEFWTHVQIEGPSATEYDHVRIVLDYPPDVVELAGVNDLPITARIEGEPTALVDAEGGRIVYEANMSKSTIAPVGPMVSFRWRALRQATNVPIEFSTMNGRPSELTNANADLLGNTGESGDGTLSVDFDVLPSDEEEIAALEDAPAFDFGSFERKGDVKLHAEVQKKPIVVGEVFTIDLVLDNSTGSALDGLELSLGFDPDVLHIVDADIDNPITAGVNILDGPFGETFPFDFNVNNTVYQTLGRIRYENGLSSRDALRGKSGTFARIYAYAKKPVASTYLKFMFAQSDGYPSTRVTYVGEDVLGNPAVADDGAENLRFSILNAPEVAARSTKP